MLRRSLCVKVGYVSSDILGTAQPQYHLQNKSCAIAVFPASLRRIKDCQNHSGYASDSSPTFRRYYTRSFNFYTLSAGHRVRNNPCRRLRFVLLNAPCFISENVGLKTFCQYCARPVVIDRNIIIANPKSKINRVLLNPKNSTYAVCYRQKADHYLQCPQVGLYVPRYDHVDALGVSYVDVSTNWASADTISIQCS